MRARACITGLGVAAPNGIGKEEFWRTLRLGISGIGPVTLFDASRLAARIAGEVKNFDARKYLKKPVKTKRMARHTQFALATAAMALDDAGLAIVEQHYDFPVPVIIGTSTSAFDIIYRSMQMMTRFGEDHATPFVVNEAAPQAVAAAIAQYVEIPTQLLTISTACAAGLDAIAHAVELIRSEKADIAIAGGTDAPIVPVPFANLSAAGLASTRNDAPEKASRPFDRDRDSGVISEGAGVVVIENLECARARGAEPYIEITGYSLKADSDWGTPACGLQDTMRQALINAGKRPEQVDYICAHGPSHPVLDRNETEMIKRVFNSLAYTIPVSSIKGVLGNPLAAAGPLQVIACALACREHLIPPTANYEIEDPACDLDYVPGQARRCQIRCALINAHGVGGGNSSMVVETV